MPAAVPVSDTRSPHCVDNINNNSTVSETPIADKLIAALQHPPFLIRFFRAFTFPAVVLTRHELGERYYRNALFGRLVFYVACAPAPLYPHPVTLFLAIGLAIAAAVQYIRADLGCRREIRTRREKRIIIHSHSMGIPRFGLPNDERTNERVIPGRLALVGLVCLPVTMLLGGYLILSGLGLCLEARWRRFKAREAELDQMDSDAPLSASISTLTSSINADTTAHRPASDPLSGFETVLAKESK